MALMSRLAWRHLVTPSSSSSTRSIIATFPIKAPCPSGFLPPSPRLRAPHRPPYFRRSVARCAASGKDSKMALLLEKLQIQRNGDAKDVFDIYVVGDEKAPGVVVVQEWWGVDFEIKNHAMTIAQKGFRALIPDLYRGKVGLDAAEAQHLMQGLDWPGAVADIAASVKWLKEHGSPKVGVTGFCMGGALTIASSVLIPEVDAVVCFYGIPPPELADPTQAKAPVQGHFGEKDSNKGFSDVESAKVLMEKLQKSGVPNEVYIYPNIAHAFMNASPEAIERKKVTGFGDHQQEVVDLAWSRFEAWFGKYLKA